jgi:hypothetical protein
MVPWFGCLLLPLWGLAFLVGELHEKEVFPFEASALNMLHSMATPTLDPFFVLMTRLGYLWGVVLMAGNAFTGAASATLYDPEGR